MNHTDYDVVVIGGGPAGSTLSTLLVRQGYQVLLLESRESISICILGLFWLFLKFTFLYASQHLFLSGFKSKIDI